MGNLLTLSFWFNSRPGALLPFMLDFFIGLIIVLVLISIVSQVLRQRNPKSAFRKIRDQLISFGYSNAVIGLILLFFTIELIPILSARFWFMLWFVGMIFWLTSMVKKAKEIPKMRSQLEEQKKYKQYIP